MRTAVGSPRPAAGPAARRAHDRVRAGAGAAPDRFLVGLATLSLLADAAERQPLVCIVDDGQWLDQASAQLLAFVGRRLLAERIALVCAARTGVGDDVFTGLPELFINGLGESDARALLLNNVYGPLDAAVCDQIVKESHGNPLALLELPRTWRAGQLAGGFGLPGSQPVAEQDRAELRSAPPTSSPPRRTGCSSSLRPRSPSATLSAPPCCRGPRPRHGCSLPAVDAGLLHVGERVEFTHPLVRSVTYHAAAADDRYRVHRALAEATDAHGPGSARLASRPSSGTTSQ